MQGQYRGNRGVRPRVVSRSGHGDASARLFLCAGCRAQALICSCCDRGQIYCAGDCGPLPGGEANVPPARVTRPAAMDGARMPSGHAATGRDAKK